MEQHYVFLKDNRVMNSAVFAEQNEELADRIAQEQGYDDALWIGANTPPAKWSTYNLITNEFTAPSNEYLISIGVLESTPVEEPVSE